MGPRKKILLDLSSGHSLLIEVAQTQGVCDID